MKKSVIAIVVVLTLIFFCAVGVLCIMENKTTNYPLCGIVEEVNGDSVVVKTHNGNLWEFYGEEWNVGDICAMIVNDNGTEEIFDDIILETRYCGYISK